MRLATKARAFLSAVIGRIWLRLLLVNVVVVLVPLFGLEFARIFERRLLYALEQNMHDQAALVRAMLEADLAQDVPLADARHDRVLAAAAKDTRTRIRVLGAAGELLADSHAHGVPEGPEPPTPRYFGRSERAARKIEDSLSWPDMATRREVVAALSGTPATQTRIASQPHAVFLFTATPIQAAGAVAGVVYVTRSTNPVLTELYRVRSGLFKLLAATLFLSVGTTLLLALSISRPLAQLSRAAKRIASGERSVALPAFGSGEIGDLSHSFKAMTEELEQQLAYISEFSADVAHEFKSPLTSIRGAAELLAEGAHADPAARDRFLRNILLDTDRLDRLVSRLLVLGRIEASAEEMTLVDLRSLLERLVSRAQARSPVELTYSASQTWIRGREADLETAIVNLLDNAQRYAPAGQAVEVGAVEEDGGVCVSVSDRGPGVPEARRDKIWSRFYTTDADSGGTGLGLAIVDSVARAHGGRVACEPASSGGSRFSIWLPSATPRHTTVHSRQQLRA